MTTRTGRRLATALLALGSGLLLGAVPASAAPAAPTADPASLTLGQLVLDPTGRGYRGALPVTVTNDSGADGHFHIRIVEPVAGSIRRTDPQDVCTYGPLVENRRSLYCDVPGGVLEPGEQRSFSVGFEVLATPRTYPMIARGGTVEVGLSDGSDTVTDLTGYSARFRSTGGSLRNPVPYVPDTQAKAAITSVGAVTLTPQADGTFQGRLPVTVRWAGDVAHDMLHVDATTLPAGVQIWGTDPQDLPSFFTSFVVPGDRFMQGEERTFDVILRAPEGTVPGDLGSAVFRLTTDWNGDPVVDAAPADNTTSFTVTATS